MDIEIAVMTPPTGLNLFVISGRTIAEVIRAAFPFVFALLIVRPLITFFPGIALVLF